GRRHGGKAAEGHRAVESFDHRALHPATGDLQDPGNPGARRRRRDPAHRRDDRARQNPKLLRRRVRGRAARLRLQGRLPARQHRVRPGAPESARRPARGDEEISGPPVNDYDALRDYLKKQTRPEFVLRFDEIEQIIGAALPRAAHRASWWETLRSPQEKMPQREACLAGGYIATRLADGNSVRFKRAK